MKARLPKGMGGGPQNMQSMIKQAQKMQEDMERVQAELEEEVTEVTAGGGVADANALMLAEVIKYATIIVSVIPILCVYPFIQKYFTKGVMVGAVKE